LGDYLLDQSVHYAEFSNDAGFNCGFNLEDKLILELSIRLRMMLNSILSDSVWC